jgi:hypothetical protein
MRRIYFRCPETGKEFSAKSGIAEDKIRGAMFPEVPCAQCGQLHTLYGKDALRSIPVPKPKGARVSR